MNYESLLVTIQGDAGSCDSAANGGLAENIASSRRPSASHDDKMNTIANTVEPSSPEGCINDADRERFLEEYRLPSSLGEGIRAKLLWNPPDIYEAKEDTVYALAPGLASLGRCLRLQTCLYSPSVASPQARSLSLLHLPAQVIGYCFPRHLILSTRGGDTPWRTR